jgi:hypothetical protein
MRPWIGPIAWAYYVGKGSHEFRRQMILWDLIDT